MIKLPFYARVALTLHAVVLTLLLMYLGRSILVPLLFAFLVSILLYPLVKFFERLHVPRVLASLTAILLLMVVLVGLIFFFSRQVMSLSKDLPGLQTRVTDKLNHIQNWIAVHYNINNSEQSAYINKSANGILSTAVNSAANTFVGIAGAFLLFVFFFFFTFFILYHRRLLMKFFLELFSDEHNERVKNVILQIRGLVHAYVLGLLFEMIILVILIFVTLTIMGVKYALLISIFAGVLNIIPYIGIYTSLLFGMLITLANASAGEAVAVGIVFLAAHFIDANIILPRVVGGRVKMNPFITIIAVLVGHLLWGIPGMFLFIPVTAMIRLVSEEVDGMKPWATLIGEESNETKKPRSRKGD
jgi:AI-2 transport protein TqsA